MKTSTVRIDNSAPVTTSNALTSYVDQAVITLSPTDPYSGVATTKYRVDGGAWQTGTEVTVTGYWTHTVQFYSTDAIGNAESPKSVTFTIRRQDRTYYHSDSRILYKGTWASGYGDAARKTSEPGAAVWFYTQASRIRYLAVKAPDAGIMRIRIDGGSWTNVDLYSASTYTWQYVYDSGDIDFDYHLVQVEYTGQQERIEFGHRGQPRRTRDRGQPAAGSRHRRAGHHIRHQHGVAARTGHRQPDVDRRYDGRCRDLLLLGRHDSDDRLLRPGTDHRRRDDPVQVLLGRQARQRRVRHHAERARRQLRAHHLPAGQHAYEPLDHDLGQPHRGRSVLGSRVHEMAA